jgi:hypothetical protein
VKSVRTAPVRTGLGEDVAGEDWLSEGGVLRGRGWVRAACSEDREG